MKPSKSTYTTIGTLVNRYLRTMLKESITNLRARIKRRRALRCACIIQFQRKCQYLYRARSSHTLRAETEPAWQIEARGSIERLRYSGKYGRVVRFSGDRGRGAEAATENEEERRRRGATAAVRGGYKLQDRLSGGVIN